MAVTPKTDEAFLREVDEEVRRDQIARLARRYGGLAIGGVLAALLALAGFLYWRHSSEQQAATESEQLQGAFDKLAAGDRAGATNDVAALAKSDRAVTRAIAQMTQADLSLQKDDIKGGVAQFEAIARDERVPQPYRELATVRSIAARYDAIPPQQVITQLTPYAVKGKPWFGSAGELVAIAYLRTGRRALAGKMFAQIAADENVPSSIRQRAVQMMGGTGSDAATVQNEVTKAQ